MQTIEKSLTSVKNCPFAETQNSLKELVYNGYIDKTFLLSRAILRGDCAAFDRLRDRRSANDLYNLFNKLKRDGHKYTGDGNIGAATENFIVQYVELLNKIAAGEDIEDLEFEINWGCEYKDLIYEGYENSDGWGQGEYYDTFTLEFTPRSKVYTSFATITYEQVREIPLNLKNILKILKWHRWDLWKLISKDVTQDHWSGNVRPRIDWMSMDALEIVYKYRPDLITRVVYKYPSPPACFYRFCEEHDITPRLEYGQH